VLSSRHAWGGLLPQPLLLPDQTQTTCTSSSVIMRAMAEREASSWWEQGAPVLAMEQHLSAMWAGWEKSKGTKIARSGWSQRLTWRDVGDVCADLVHEARLCRTEGVRKKRVLLGWVPLPPSPCRKITGCAKEEKKWRASRQELVVVAGQAEGSAVQASLSFDDRIARNCLYMQRCSKQTTSWHPRF